MAACRNVGTITAVLRCRVKRSEAELEFDEPRYPLFDAALVTHPTGALLVPPRLVPLATIERCTAALRQAGVTVLTSVYATSWLSTCAPLMPLPQSCMM